MSNIRLKDIAKKVGVSTTAVCNVLNSKPIRIREEKRKEILKLAEKLNYKPDIIASGLKNKSTKSIGVVIPDIRTLFFPEIILTIEKNIRKRGYHTIICNTEDNPELEKEQIENLLARRIDALVIVPADGMKNLKFFRSINKESIPILFMDRYNYDEFNFVATDNVNGAIKGLKTLLQTNKDLKRIIYLGDNRRNQSLDDRLEGIKKELSSNGLTLANKDIFLCRQERKIIETAGYKIFSQDLHNAGIFLESNRCLPGLLDAARKFNKKIPDDVHVIGFDKFEFEICSAEDLASIKVLTKAIPIIHQDIRGISKAVAEYILACLEKHEKLEIKLKLPVKIEIND
ncbi:MAG: LacI family DNA-binding transcriptional regulator [Victivallaceae bacterium]|nr:LacI family DNA-binding transcriptional regulator [Victivallaceae bacterium]